MKFSTALCAFVALLSAASSVAAQSNSSTATITNTSSSSTSVEWPKSIPLQQSVQYVMPSYDLSKLPKFTWSLANESFTLRTSICGMQVDFCKKAGCDAAVGAKETKVADNFCDQVTLASKCTCSGGISRLQKFQWPVMTQDCRFRGQACRNQCMYGGTLTNQMPSCIAACNNVFGMQCGLPGQMAANYVVNRKGEKPNLVLTQGGGSQSAAAAAMHLPARGTTTATALAVVGLAFTLF
ncbi:hypothetical protein K437DRAFT_254921 [Tilletiaria anomala UBC 951]|uniref:Uncharacterized protein n=1 Tax=Tilletiaria anomala (strain ATCC 24038 / CBS 436.72 / UBC 951) TaxID=1037660 RepID=A0A066WFR8_TILAU|nr:uncharacterized protein K437DRAFT_254921 [Tilletiaria anomala UBC 951]KDN51333.1 hypothetical protein K437DRAFT_254921 [Tilletiaria anomala UBC 951]